jgi:bifunctional UDP-N-acetylglucosamine pyrophosphorylase/glucosamine-1-phosphate N-acetyltransferase
VTCNYDGVNKFKTVIGDGVFVGSGTLMVAPVTLEAGATIGAGSVVTKTAPAGQLTVARAKQLTVPGWQRPQKLK